MMIAGSGRATLPSLPLTAVSAVVMAKRAALPLPFMPLIWALFEIEASLK